MGRIMPGERLNKRIVSQFGRRARITAFRLGLQGFSEWICWLSAGVEGGAIFCANCAAIFISADILRTVLHHIQGRERLLCVGSFNEFSIDYL